MPRTEAFARTFIDARLGDQGWNVSDDISVRSQQSAAIAKAQAAFDALLARCFDPATAKDIRGAA